MRLLNDIMVCVLAASASGLGTAEPAVVAQSGDRAAGFVERFLASEGPPVRSYRAVRTLEAETRGGQMRARVVALTSFDSVDGFQYTILEEDGAAIIRQKVLRATLEAERVMRTGGEAEHAAFTRQNYDFREAREAEGGLVQIGLHPKRPDALLLEGTMVVSASSGDLVRVEGTMVKRPSFWTRRVDVVRRWERISGVRVPVTMETTAHVLIVGISTFSMRYEYESINGEPIVGRAVEQTAPAVLSR